MRGYGYHLPIEQWFDSQELCYSSMTNGLAGFVGQAIRAGRGRDPEEIYRKTQNHPPVLRFFLVV
jgi:hypothetical protein